MPKANFNIKDYVEGQGMKLIGAGSRPGTALVQNAEGHQLEFDAKEVVPDFSKQYGIKPSDINIEFNSPEAPIGDSPVDVTDRFKLAFGNASGSLSYLKSKFGDAKYIPEQGLVVKNKGVWQPVDPSNLGDPWKTSKEIASDAAELIPAAVSIAGQIGAGALGGSAGLAAAGPAGAAAGARLASGAAGGAVEAGRALIGRYLGTYDATPESLVKDIGIETAIALGGSQLAAGVKPALSALVRSAGSLGEAAAPAMKSFWAETVGKLTGNSSERVAVWMDKDLGGEVAKTLDRAAVGRGSDELPEFLAKQVNDRSEQFLESAQPALTRKYGEKLGELKVAAKNMGEVNLGAIPTRALNDLEQAGIVYAEQGKEPGKLIYKVMDDARAVAYQNAGKEAQLLSPQAQKELAPLIKQLNNYTAFDKASGSEAAERMMSMQKAMNELARTSEKDGFTPLTKSILDRTKTTTRSQIMSVFEEQGLAQNYLDTVNVYQKYADAVKEAQKLLKSDSGPQRFARALTSNVVRHSQADEMSKNLVELMGNSGKEQLKSLLVHDAALGASTWLPKQGLAANNVSSMAAGGLAFTGNIPGAIATAAATSPKAQFAATRAAIKAAEIPLRGVSWLKSLPPKQLKEFINTPEAVQAFTQTVLQTTAQGKKLEASLVNQVTGAQ